MAPKHKAHVSAKKDKQSKKVFKMKILLDSTSCNIEEKKLKKVLGKHFDDKNDRLCGFSIIKMKTSFPEQLSKETINDSLDFSIEELNQLLQNN